MALCVVWQTPHILFSAGAHVSEEKSCAVPAICEKQLTLIMDKKRNVRIVHFVFMIKLVLGQLRYKKKSNCSVHIKNSQIFIKIKNFEQGPVWAKGLDCKNQLVLRILMLTIIIG